MTELNTPPSASSTHSAAGCLLWLLTVLLAAFSLRADGVMLSADFSVPTGTIRPLHGINKGPLAPGGIFDVIKEQKELGIPFTRLHDCGWPNPYVVDHHVVFPNPNADPTLPESYDFRLTDEYIEAVRKTGAEPIYRLGESNARLQTKFSAELAAIWLNLLGRDFLLWGSDWPCTNFESDANYSHLRDKLEHWLPDAEDKHAALHDNPQRLYWR